MYNLQAANKLCRAMTLIEKPLPGTKSATDRVQINVQQYRGGLVFKAHRLVYHSTLGLRVIKKKKELMQVGSDRPSPFSLH